MLTDRQRISMRKKAVFLFRHGLPWLFTVFIE